MLAQKLQLSKKRRMQKTKARQQIYKISKSKKARKQEKEEKSIARKAKELYKRVTIPLKRSRVLPIRKSIKYNVKSDKSLEGRGALCREAHKNVELCKSKFEALGVAVPTIFAMEFTWADYDVSKALEYNWTNPILTPGVYFEPPITIFRTEYKEQGKYALLSFPESQLQLVLNTVSDYKYVRMNIALHNRERHSISVLITPAKVYVLQSWQAPEASEWELVIDPVREMLSAVFQKEVVYAPDNLFSPGYNIAIQKEDELLLFSEGECAAWAIIIPYALCNWIVGTYGTLEMLTDELLVQFYEYASKYWTFPDTYNDYMQELGLLGAA